MSQLKKFKEGVVFQEKSQRQYGLYDNDVDRDTWLILEIDWRGSEGSEALIGMFLHHQTSTIVCEHYINIENYVVIIG